MRHSHIRDAFGFKATALVLGVLLLGFGLLPAGTAEAHWWPWGHYAHAEDNNDDDPSATSTVTVHITKYIDDEPATNESADGHSFPMTASWDDVAGDGEGSGNYQLSAGNGYAAMTSGLHVGADYSTSETLDGDIVDASCHDGNPYALVGYSTGASAEAAAAADVSTNTPSLTDLSADQYIIVWNETCDDGGGTGNATSTGNISGEVTGGSSGEEDTGELAVTSIDAQKTTAIANGEFADGWQYVFHITVPTDEPDLAMKFANWLHTNGTSTIPVANNMRISSDEADNGGATVTLTAADTYSSPELTMTGDLDSEEDGLQVEVLVEVAVPSGTLNGTYSTSYGVRTLP